MNSFCQHALDLKRKGCSMREVKSNAAWTMHFLARFITVSALGGAFLAFTSCGEGMNEPNSDPQETVASQAQAVNTDVTPNEANGDPQDMVASHVKELTPSVTGKGYCQVYQQGGLSGNFTSYGKFALGPKGISIWAVGRNCIVLINSAKAGCYRTILSGNYIHFSNTEACGTPPGKVEIWPQ